MCILPRIKPIRPREDVWNPILVLSPALGAVCSAFPLAYRATNDDLVLHWVVVSFFVVMTSAILCVLVVRILFWRPLDPWIKRAQELRQQGRVAEAEMFEEFRRIVFEKSTDSKADKPTRGSQQRP